MHIQRNIAVRSWNYFCNGKAKLILCVCVCVCVALGIQHAMRMHRTVICRLPNVQYFSTLSQKRHVIRKKVIE